MLTLGNGLLILLGTDASLGKIIGLLVAGGLGFGSCIQTLTLAAQSAVTGKDLAATTTVNLFFRSLGQILSVAVMSNIIQNKLRTEIGEVVARFPAHMHEILEVLKDQSTISSSGMPEGVKDAIQFAYWDSLKVGFVALTAFTGVFLLLTLGIQHKELKTTLKKTIDDQS
ncbi:hypothetical protein EC988_006758 [Linderina pennispora]|nr:hypothetical protein EC988_006758 [Linderina pennispora]